LTLLVVGEGITVVFRDPSDSVVLVLVTFMLVVLVLVEDCVLVDSSNPELDTLLVVVVGNDGILVAP